MNDFIDAAKRYLKRGWHPVPCQVRGKTPLVPWKTYQEQQPTWDDVESWWYGEQGSELPNLALVMGRGTFALDIDGPEALGALYAAGVSLQELLAPNPPVVATGKGLHLYFRGAVGDRVAVVPKVDVRGVGYVVAPPSIHPLGHPYLWLLNEDSETPPAPDSLLKLLETKKPAAPTGAGLGWRPRMLLEGVREGRNHGMAKLVGAYWGLGLYREEIEVLLRHFIAQSKGSHEFTEQEFQSTLRSITSREGGPRD
jgi:hypothetical protein